jgi:hypothetical protein
MYLRNVATSDDTLKPQATERIFFVSSTFLKKLWVIWLASYGISHPIYVSLSKYREKNQQSFPDSSTKNLFLFIQTYNCSPGSTHPSSSREHLRRVSQRVAPPWPPAANPGTHCPHVGRRRRFRTLLLMKMSHRNLRRALGHRRAWD